MIKSPYLTEEQAKIVEDMLPSRTIFLGFRGSLVHGTYDEESGIDDIDLMGIHVGPLEHYLGFRRKGQETIDRSEGKIDFVSHELRKFIGLLHKNNPNVHQLLWLPDEFIVFATKEGARLRNSRDFFPSKEAYHRYRGYAYSQLEKMKKSEDNAYKGYMGEKRKALVDEYGYDTKYASHLIRLLLTGIRFLRTGAIELPDPDAGMLLAIKQGEWSKEDVIQKAEVLLHDLELAKDFSDLPEETNRDHVEELLVSLVMSYYNLVQHKGWL